MNIPIAISSYTASLSPIGPIPQTTQEMVNEAIEALATAEAFRPPYKSALAPVYRDLPWIPRMGMCVNACAMWSSRLTRVPVEQVILFQLWRRRHLRSISDADLRRAWGPCGVSPLNYRIAR